MAYYPIKCPYCLHELSNNDVRFNLRVGGVAGRAREIRGNDFSHDRPAVNATGDSQSGWQASSANDNYQSYDSANADDDDFSDAGSWAHDNDSGPGAGGDAYGAPSAAAAERRFHSIAELTESKESPFYTYSELVRYFGEENVKPILNRDVHAPPALANKPEYKEDLLVGVEITTRKDGKETTTTYRKRYCECEKELMNASGMKAGYVLLMLGPTSSGKTMFLIALHKAMKIDGGYLLPPEGSGSRGLAKLIVTVLSGGLRGEDTSLEKMSDELFEFGKLPLSTFALDNEPLVLDVSVLFKGGKSTNALLFLRDMPGEYLTNPEKTEELHRIAHQFPLFDGFVMMLDPFTFTERSVFQGDGTSDTSDRQKLKFVDNLNQVLADTIAPFAGSNRINKPTAVIITKGDHFFEPRNTLRLQQKGVERSFPILGAWQKESYDRHYFREIDRDVNRILNSLSRNVINMLDGNFSNVFYALVSALSKGPLDMESRMVVEKIGGREAEVERSFVVTPSAIRPWRVADPFIRILMRLNIVPPFDEVEIRQPDLEDYESALARNSKYLAAVNAWGRTYCTAWDEISGVAVDPLPERGAKIGKVIKRKR